MHHPSRRVLILSVCVLVATPVALYFMQAARTPILHAGDRLEKRVCRDCGGDGKSYGFDEPLPPRLERCPACGGDGEVDVVLPGPERPTRIRGAVANKATLSPFATYREVRPGGVRTLERPSGTIGGAPVRFERHDGRVFEIEANPHGLFHTQLPPGLYRVKVAASGFVPLDAELEVPILTRAIWIDEAIIIREIGSGEEAQARHGFEVLIALSPDDRDESSIIVTHGGPHGGP